MVKNINSACALNGYLRLFTITPGQNIIGISHLFAIAQFVGLRSEYFNLFKTTAMASSNG